MKVVQAAGAPPLALAEAAVRPVDELLKRLGTSPAGLAGPEAAARLAKLGPNVLPTRPVTAWAILLGQLRNPLLVLLLAAAAVSALTGGVTEAAIIAAIMVLSVGLGFVNEYRSAKAVAALHGDVHHQALVWRDGEQRELDVSLLVPGDVVGLRVGAVVPADLRIMESDQLECDEAVLTGESAAAVKTAEPVTRTDSGVELPPCAFIEGDHAGARIIGSSPRRGWLKAASRARVRLPSVETTRRPVGTTDQQL